MKQMIIYNTKLEIVITLLYSFYHLCHNAVFYNGKYNSLSNCCWESPGVESTVRHNSNGMSAVTMDLL